MSPDHPLFRPDAPPKIRDSLPPRATPDIRPAYDPLRFVMPRALYDELMAYVLLCPVEINGFGTVTRSVVNGIDTITVDEIFITEQTVSMAHAGVSDQVLARLIGDFIRNGEDPSSIRLQWHSHVNGPTDFSAQDIRTIDTQYPGAEWLISLVVNKQGDRDARLDIFQPFRSRRRLEMIIDNGEIDPAVVAHCLKEIKAKVTVQRGFLGRLQPVVSHNTPNTPQPSRLTGMVVSELSSPEGSIE